MSQGSSIQTKVLKSVGPGLMSKWAAAQWADVSARTIERWITAGLPIYRERPRSKVLLKETDLEKFLSRHRKEKGNE